MGISVDFEVSMVLTVTDPAERRRLGEFPSENEMADEPVLQGDGMLVAVPPPTDAQLDVLAHICEMILAWPCPDCGQPGPCCCDTKLTERLRASGCAESDICAILPVEKKAGHTGADNTNAALGHNAGVSGAGPTGF